MAIKSENLLLPISSAWLGKLSVAKQAKKTFQDVADQCMTFYTCTLGSFWEDKFQQRFLGSSIKPKFRIQIGKAFELVALYGPSLYHRNPARAVRPYETLEFGPDLFGDPNDPAVQQVFQEAAAREMANYSQNKFRCQLMERYLSYTPREQPAGGLEYAATAAITEMLIKGRGLLWAQSYSNPLSQKRLTGLFYDTVDRLHIDPDAKSHHFGEAKWISRTHVDPYWEVERKFSLKRNTLKGKGNIESGESKGGRALTARRGENRTGNTYDLIVWHEFWSIGGVGTRLSGSDQWMAEAFDDVVGDYAYIVVAPGVNFPLNCPPASAVDDPALSFEAMDDEAVKKAFAWPVPYYLDQKWPCVMLDGYMVPNSPWPLAHLAPGLGELTALNIITSGMVNRTWDNSRTFIACLESIADKIEKTYLNGSDLAVMRIPEMTKDLEQIVKFIRAPDQSKDTLTTINYLFNLFDKRVGLTELMYGLNPGGVASRSATDIAAKSERMAIRPDDLSKRVAKWMTEGAETEKFCAYWSGISGQDIGPLIGEVGAYFWDRLIANEEPDVVIHNMRCTVEASDVRRPNKERDAQNMGQLYQPLSQQFGQYAMTTGDFGPLNAVNRRLFKTLDQPWEADLDMNPPPPPPPEPQVDPEAEAKQAMEQEKHDAALEKEAENLKQSRERHTMDLALKRLAATQKTQTNGAAK
jgi:hypothetical protein